MGYYKDQTHHQKLIMSFTCVEYNVSNVYFLHLNFVIARNKIQFSEALCAMKLIQEVDNDMNGNLSLIVNLLRE
jgi:hypothetical protein